MYRYYNRQLPTDLTAIQEYDPSVLSQVYAADGTVIGEFYIQRRVVVPLDSIPRVVKQAFVAAEDGRFFEHSGVDFLRIAKAFLKNLEPRKRPQGGSTITQQIAREFFLDREISYSRKIREAILAYRIERELNKGQILHLYLNQIYFGHGAYGVEAAAQNYFGRHVNELGLAEGAMLAGLPKAPSHYSPINNFQGAKQRQVYTLQRMFKEGFITLRQAKRAAKQDIQIDSWEDRNHQVASYFVEQVRKNVRLNYGSESIYRDGLQIYTGLDLQIQMAANQAIQEGLRALDQDMGFRGRIGFLSPRQVKSYLQKQAEEIRSAKVGGSSRDQNIKLDEGEKYRAVVSKVGNRVRLRIGSSRAILDEDESKWARRTLRNEGVATERSLRRGLGPGDIVDVRVLGREGDIYRVSLDQDPLIQGALVAIDPSNGYVRSLVGGYDYTSSQFDRAIQARRQPGSAFKPIIYSVAMDSLDYTQMTVVVDAPITIKDWTPRNFKGKFMGPQTLRSALAKSLNSVSVRLTDRLGPQAVVERARRLGITTPLGPNPSIALGSSEISLLELTKAYTVFAAAGRKVEPVFITMIRDRKGRVLEDNRFVNRPGKWHERGRETDSPNGQAEKGDEEYAISPQTAYIMTNMLQAVVERGTARRVKELGRPTAGKTGTNGLTDVWFVGYTPELVAGTWVGYDDRRPMGERYTGGYVAAPIWLDFMKGALFDKPSREFEVPEGIAFNYLSTRGEILSDERGGEPVAFKAGTERFPGSAIAGDGWRSSPGGDGQRTDQGHFRDRFAGKPGAARQNPKSESKFQF